MDPMMTEEDSVAVTVFFRAHPLSFDSTRRTVHVEAWLHDMEQTFLMCHIPDYLEIMLAANCLYGDARLWWIDIGERQVPSRTWAQFRAVMLARYGPLPPRDEGAPARDPDIYRDMRHTQYQMLSQAWHAYPGEMMSHYWWRFEEMMHPHIPQDLPEPQLEAVTLLVNGTPPHIRQHVPQPTLHSTVAGTLDDILAAEIIAQDAGNDAPANPEQPPVDDADEPEPQYEVGPLAGEDEDPQYEVGPLEDEMEHAQIPLIIISSDDEDEEDDNEDMEDPEQIPDDEEDPEEGYKMVHPRKTMPVNPPAQDLTAILANIQRQLQEQQQEMTLIREQLAQQNQGPRVQEVPPPAQPVPLAVPPVQPIPPVAPQVPNIPPVAQPEVRQEIPRNAEVPVAAAEVQMQPQPVREDLLYERFRRMKAPEFEGPIDPIAADNWLIDMQVILDFMRLTEQEKVLCASFALKKNARHWWITVQMRRNVLTMSWQDFVDEFRAMYYNNEVLAAQQDELTSFTQGSMTVMEAVKKFEQLARLCPNLITSETEKVRLMMKMFRTDIARQVSAGNSPSVTVSDCIERALRAESFVV
uniref:Retrotransposon gag domain-containing protein n=1 Tax=Ficus carica TaxID=3494 RepID=A0AA88D8A1_FICCA|nr:hypothetical protein TIFTF001_046396 [Ficus carica]